MHLLNPLQASCYFVHSIQSHPCPLLHNLIILLKGNQIVLAVASSISMHSVPGGRYFHPLPIPTLHCIFIPSATSARKARVLRTPCPITAYPNHSPKSTIHFFRKIELHTYTQKIKKKAKVSGSPLGCKVKMYF
jgi:hypothetical protein